MVSMRTPATWILTAFVLASAWAAIADGGLAQGDAGGQGKGNGGGQGQGNGGGSGGQGAGNAVSDTNGGNAGNGGGQGDGAGSSNGGSGNGGGQGQGNGGGASGTGGQGQGSGNSGSGSNSGNAGGGQGQGDGAAPANGGSNGNGGGQGQGNDGASGTGGNGGTGNGASGDQAGGASPGPAGGDGDGSPSQDHKSGGPKGDAGSSNGAAGDNAPDHARSNGNGRPQGPEHHGGAGGPGTDDEGDTGATDHGRSVEPSDAVPGDNGRDRAEERRRPTIDEGGGAAPATTPDVDDLGTRARPERVEESMAVLDGETGFRTTRTGATETPVVDYDAEAAVLTVESPDRPTRFSSRITGLLEYIDGNGNGAYDLGEDVVQDVPLTGIAPDIFVGLHDESAREVVYHLPGGGALTLVFHLGSGGHVGAKYDVVVEGFPFRSETSRLAVGASAETGGGIRILDVDGSPAVAGAGDDSVGYLAWVTEAIVDGTAVPVGWSVHVSHSATSEAVMIYWSYPQGLHILHDPEIGFIDLPPELLGDAELFVYGLVATGTVLLIGYELRRRRTW